MKLLTLRTVSSGVAGRTAISNSYVQGLYHVSRLTTTARRYAATDPVANRPNSQSIKVSVEKGNQILANQRLNRPVAPHLGVYKLQQTWLGSSAWMRITGCTLSGAMYAYFISFLFAPAFGMNLDSSALVASFAGLPLLAQNAVKFAFTFPFTFHFFNGIKHLVYDAGIGYAKDTIVRADYFLWGISLFVTPWIVFWL